MARARLHLNENPFPPSPRVGMYLARYFYLFNRYDSKELTDRLYELLSNYVGFDREYIDVYPSSSAAITSIMFYARCKGARFVTSRPGFFALEEYARIAEIHVNYFELKPKSFEIDLEKLMRVVDSNTVLFIANPNNPTSNILINDAKLVEELCSIAHLVVLDEAYFEFSNVTFIDLVRKLPNLVIVRTLSKAFALAGARIGYIVAQPHLIKELSRYRIGYDVPLPSIVCAIAALEDLDYARKTVETIKFLREKMRRELESMGLYVVPSATNFLFVEVGDGTKVARELEARGILVKFFDDPLTKEFIRVSVGREEENRKFIEALRKILGR